MSIDREREYTPFNMNDYIRVKLTDKGRGILEKQHQEWQRLYPETFERPYVSEEKDGWYRVQAWRLFNIFGEHLSMSEALPFNANIEIERNMKES